MRPYRSQQWTEQGKSEVKPGLKFEIACEGLKIVLEITGQSYTMDAFINIEVYTYENVTCYLLKGAVVDLLFFFSLDMLFDYLYK